MNTVDIIGAGLAGSEAAWQLAQHGVHVNLYEMRPVKFTPVHKTEYFGELVCSNSLRSDKPENAVGLLKEEMRMLGSLIMESADKNRVPAGSALAVDRIGFSKMITEKLKDHPLIDVIKKEVTEIPENDYCIIASGPLTTDALSDAIQNLINKEYLHFYDAVAPIVLYDSLDMDKIFKASRYNRGDDYLNCPMNKEEYEKFYNALITAEKAEVKSFENNKVFEGCMPVEVMAERGIDTLLFGPLKPVGLIDPKTSKQPYAVIQLRQDNAAGTMYNIVGFQTHLKFNEQKRVFRMIPGLENAEFARFGVMHRNTYINSPELLNFSYQMRSKHNIFFAGQMTGVEGYVESASSGLVAGLSLALYLNGKDMPDFTVKTAIGALSHYISENHNVNFQPMNVNHGIMEMPEKHIRNKKEKNLLIANESINIIKELIGGYNI